MMIWWGDTGYDIHAFRGTTSRSLRADLRLCERIDDLARVFASVDDLTTIAEGAALAGGDRSYAGLREAAAQTAATRRRPRLQIVPRVQVSNHHAHVVAVRKDDNLRNLDSSEFVEAIQSATISTTTYVRSTES